MPEHLILAAVAVLIATALQAATGIGLGLIAGPALVVAMGSASAVPVAIVLNLALSLAFIASELGEVNGPLLARLCLGTIVGIPLGALMLASVEVSTLKLVAALAICLGALQLWRGARRPATAPIRASAAASASITGVGVLSGVMSACLAMPGPSAMWGLWRAGEPAIRVRATLRALFVFSYSAALATHAMTGVRWSLVLETFLTLLPAMTVGALLGRVAKRHLSERALGLALLSSLAVTGVVLLGDVARTVPW